MALLSLESSLCSPRRWNGYLEGLRHAPASAELCSEPAGAMPVGGIVPGLAFGEAETEWTECPSDGSRQRERQGWRLRALSGWDGAWGWSLTFGPGAEEARAGKAAAARGAGALAAQAGRKGVEKGVVPGSCVSVPCQAVEPLVEVQGLSEKASDSKKMRPGFRWIASPALDRCTTGEAGEAEIVCPVRRAPRGALKPMSMSNAARARQKGERARTGLLEGGLLLGLFVAASG